MGYVDKSLIEKCIDAAYDTWAAGSGKYKAYRSPKNDPKIRKWLEQFVIPTLEIALMPTWMGMDFAAEEKQPDPAEAKYLVRSVTGPLPAARIDEIPVTVTAANLQEPLARETERFDSRPAGDRWAHWRPR